MIFKDSQLIVEILLIVVLIAGIISSRLIVKRLGVIRESYAALNKMVASLDSSTARADRMFERIRQEMHQGDKRLSALLARVQNAEEDFSDQHDKAHGMHVALSEILTQVKHQETALESMLESAQGAVNEIQEHIDHYRTLPPIEQEELLPESHPTAEEKAPLLEAATSIEAEKESSAADVSAEEDAAPHFSDSITAALPSRMQGPRPYLRRRDGEAHK